MLPAVPGLLRQNAATYLTGDSFTVHPTDGRRPNVLPCQCPAAGTARVAPRSATGAGPYLRMVSALAATVK